MIAALRRGLATMLMVAGIVALAMACAYIAHVDATVAAIVLLLSVLLAGVYSKRTEALAASITATLCLDYFFIPPIGRVTIADAQGCVILAVFLCVSLVATNRSSQLRKQHDALVAQQIESEKLHALSRAILMSNAGEHLRRLLVNKCMELFGFSESVLFEIATGEFYRSQMDGSISIEDVRRAALRGVMERANGVTIMPVVLGNKIFGAFAFRGITLADGALQSLGNTVAMGLAQAQAQEAASRAEAIRKGEELKSVMIDALAHELKTPLTAIEASADMLLQPANVSKEQRDDLLEVIQQESRGLRRLLAEAIHLARIDAKRMKLECEPLRVDEILAEAVQSLGERLSAHEIKIETGNDTPSIFADRELTVQAVKQLLDNASKYSPAGSVIRIAAHEMDGLVSISVRDQGQGLTHLEQRRVFDKFYRVRRDRSAVQGTGMGLAIAKEIAEAHGGSVTVESRFGEGSEFTFTVPSAVGNARLESHTA
jgi:two-component system, OmpR family, sensor histidine kinase KdpD